MRRRRRRRRDEACMRGFVFCLHTKSHRGDPLPDERVDGSQAMACASLPSPLVMLTVRVPDPTPGAGEAYAEFYVRGLCG